MTQKQLSELSGISEASLSRYLNGSLEPRFDVVIKIANVFDITPNELLGKENISCENDFEKTLVLVARNKKIFTEEQKAEIIKALFK